ncbi:MAG: PIN domain-containing protein, partial [Micrococcales bacterium]|nr:PIN domain-containing protein [Micrococcales bacterium]
MIVLDACVLIAFADPANVFNADAARILTTAEPLVISALSGAEIMVHPLPDQQHHWWEMLADFGIDVVPVTRDDMEALAAVRRESGLKMPDAIILWLAE